MGSFIEKDAETGIMISLYFDHLVNFSNGQGCQQECGGPTEQEDCPDRHERPTEVYYDAAQPRYVHVKDEVHGLRKEEADGQAS